MYEEIENLMIRDDFGYVDETDDDYYDGLMEWRDDNESI